MRLIEFTGMVQRSPDFSTIKHNQDFRPLVEQHALRGINEQQIKHESQQVIEKDEVDNYMKKFDARDKGSNEYERPDKGKRKKKKGKVEEKVITIHRHIDIKI